MSSPPEETVTGPGDSEDTGEESDDDGIEPELYAKLVKSVVQRGHSWVLFKLGTAVFLPSPSAGDDLRQIASDFLSEWGKVIPGSSYGDFHTVSLEDGQGYAVACHRAEILTFIVPSEVGKEKSERPHGSEKYQIGFYGRAKRHADSQNLEIVSVGDARNMES